MVASEATRHFAGANAASHLTVYKGTRQRGNGNLNDDSLGGITDGICSSGSVNPAPGSPPSSADAWAHVKFPPARFWKGVPSSVPERMAADTHSAVDTLTTLLSVGVPLLVLGVALLDRPADRLREKRERALAGLGFSEVAPRHYQVRFEGMPVWLELGDDTSRLIVGWPPRGELTLVRGRASDPLGDPAFDREVDTRGRTVPALAFLSADAREAMRLAVGRGWRLTSHGLERSLTFERPDELASALKEGALAARTLPRRRVTLIEGLLERLADDPHVGVRRRALAEIIKRADADDQELEQAVALCRKDPDPELRLFAARRDADPATLSGIALAASAAPPQRAEALSILLSRRPGHLVTHDLLGRLRQLAEGQPAPGLDPEAACAMLRVLGPHLDAADPQLAASVRAIVEAALRGSTPLALAAIDTVTAHGGLWAVPLLLPLRDKKLPDSLKSAAARAIDFIQARAGGDAGGLSLTADGGALALSAES